MSDGETGVGGDTPTGGAKRPMSKTPMFTARHSARYERQDLIKQIDEAEETHLICYVAGPNTEIDRDDIIGFVDLLHNIREGEPIDLMLHTVGGDVDACEKLMRLVHANVGEAPLRVIVPDMAKSSGTIMALGANRILMSDSSELGMIDPQFPMRDNQGNEFWHSVIAYLEAHEEHAHLRQFAVGFPHLAKNVFGLCSEMENKEAVAQVLLDVMLEDPHISEFQLFWFGMMLDEYLMDTHLAPNLITALDRHPGATDISRAKILEIADHRYGLPEMRESYLREGRSDWLAWASAVGSREMNKQARNYLLDYFKNGSDMNRLIAEIVQKE